LPVRVSGPAVASFQSAGLAEKQTLEPNAMYYFALVQERLQLEQIGLAEAQAAAPGQPLARFAPRPVPAGQDPTPPRLAEISVKILVDDDEPATREVWEKRLRSRVEAASQIFERACFVRFRVVAVDTWKSDNSINDFALSLAEFERKVKPDPARIAIGFTSQYQATRGRTHAGGTRGPLNTHLLVREWSHILNEPERLELLVHELGHFLGSVHSPEPNSVMRTVLGDRQARAASFRIGFDPMNTLAMCLVSEELRDRPHAALAEFSFQRQMLLHQIYAEMVQALPGDPTAVRFVSYIERARQGSFALGAKRVVQAVAQAAAENSRLPIVLSDGSAGRVRAIGDELMAFYFRRGADAARTLPRETAVNSFLLGMGLALDTSGVLRKNAAASSLCRTIETDHERRARLAVIGVPKARDRHELAERFALAAGLDALLGPRGAETAALKNEQQNAELSAGFSFAAYQADLAGIVFGEQLRSASLSLEAVVGGFRAERFLPVESGLPETMSWRDFTDRYGSFTDERFHELRQGIGQRIDEVWRQNRPRFEKPSQPR
jgi:hypothetical protein